jgi:YVTN family beta-propeller protein
MYTGMDPDLTQLGTIGVAHGPISDVAADSAGGSALVVANYGSDSVSVINTDSLTVESTVAVGGEPLSVAVADNRAYVGTTSERYDSVSVVDTDTGTLVGAYPLDFSVTGVTVSPDRKRVYVARTGRQMADIAIIDVTTDEVSTVEVAARPGVVADAVRVSLDGRRVYATVCDTDGDSLVAVDAEAGRVIGTASIPSPIRDVVVGPDGSVAYVLAADPRRGGLVIVVDTATNDITDTVEIGGWPTQMALSPEGTRAYVVNRDHVDVICTMTNEVVDAITVGGQPSCVAASVDGARLYVADYSGTVAALSVAPAVTLPSLQVMAMNVLAVPEVRELEPAAV